MMYTLEGNRFKLKRSNLSKTDVEKYCNEIEKSEKVLFLKDDIFNGRIGLVLILMHIYELTDNEGVYTLYHRFLSKVLNNLFFYKKGLITVNYHTGSSIEDILIVQASLCYLFSYLFFKTKDKNYKYIYGKLHITQNLFFDNYVKNINDSLLYKYDNTVQKNRDLSNTLYKVSILRKLSFYLINSFKVKNFNDPYSLIFGYNDNRNNNNLYPNYSREFLNLTDINTHYMSAKRHLYKICPNNQLKLKFNIFTNGYSSYRYLKYKEIIKFTSNNKIETCKYKVLYKKNKLLKDEIFYKLLFYNSAIAELIKYNSNPILLDFKENILNQTKNKCLALNKSNWLSQKLVINPISKIINTFGIAGIDSEFVIIIPRTMHPLIPNIIPSKNDFVYIIQQFDKANSPEKVLTNVEQQYKQMGFEFTKKSYLYYYNLIREFVHFDILVPISLKNFLKSL